MKTILLILLTATSLCSAQEEFSFRNFTTADGLSQSYVYCITQDAHGFIWAGTRDGLNRFDGYTFKQYHHREGDSTSLPHDVVSAFAKDSKGNVWIKTYERISRIETETGKIYPLPIPEGVSVISGEGTTSNFCIDKSDNIWFISSVRNLYKYTFTQKKWERVFINEATSSDSCTSISCTKSGTIYCNVKGRLYFQSGDTNNFTEVKLTYSSGQDTLQSFHGIYEGNNHTLWGFNGTGVYRIDIPQQGATLVVPLVGWKSSIKQTPDNTLWIVSESGIHCVNPNNPKQLYTIPCNEYNQHSLPTCKVNNLFWDNNHRLWVGSENGLSLYSPNAHRFKTYSSTSRNHILTENAVRTIAETKSGQIVVGETGGSVDVFDATTKQWSAGKFSKKLHKKSTSSNTIVVHNSGDIWIGLTNIGILRLNGSFEIQSVYTNANRNIGDLEQYKIPLNIGHVYTLYEDEDETIWAGNYNSSFGTAATLYHFFPRTGKVIQFTPSTYEEQIGSSIFSMSSKNTNEL
jgi:ligand-binding sensor domain-containing protein